jgi:protocatechuate 4,5-dioxygenase, alpha chain
MRACRTIRNLHFPSGNSTPRPGRRGKNAAVPNRSSKRFAHIPGTVVFDAEHGRRGYRLNMWCLTLMKEENRAAFQKDAAAYLARHELSAEEREAILARDYNRMLELGGNIYYLSRIAATDGHSFQKIGAMMSGMTEEAFRQMMLAGGRKPHG